MVPHDNAECVARRGPNSQHTRCAASAEGEGELVAGVFGPGAAVGVVPACLLNYGEDILGIVDDRHRESVGYRAAVFRLAFMHSGAVEPYHVCVLRGERKILQVNGLVIIWEPLSGNWKTSVLIAYGYACLLPIQKGLEVELWLQLNCIEQTAARMQLEAMGATPYR